MAGVECNEPPVNHDWGLNSFDPSHPDTCKLGHYRCSGHLVRLRGADYTAPFAFLRRLEGMWRNWQTRWI